MWQTLLTHTPLLYMAQSVWRDEAFSILAARQSLWFILTRLGFEPPVYYYLLHFWIRLFGDGEIAARILSVIGFTLAGIIMIEWGYALFKKHWLSWYMPLFFLVNPMLLYYAFEVRTYAWYLFFATATLFTYTKRQWRWFTVSAILGFYTHVYILPFIGALFLDWVWSNRKRISPKIKTIRSVPGFMPFVIIAVASVPWILKILTEAARMKSSWYYPVDWQLVKSALGNMFLGYEGTPWFGWKYTRYLSLLLIGLGALSFSNEKLKRQTTAIVLFGIIPLATIIGISFVKPLYVNRYLIPTTLAEVLIVVTALSAIRHVWVQRGLAVVLLAGTLWLDWWIAPFHTKLPMRTTMQAVNQLARPSDIILADDPLIYLETLYYASRRSQVYLYNPTSSPFPWYIGEALITPSRMAPTVPYYPRLGILVHNDATYDIVYQTPL